MLFSFLVGFTALLVAGSAAYFSVIGIATLFSGHFLQVAIMAGSLELGKLVTTSFLYRYWKKIVWFLKLYMIGAVLVLMAITSMGIYGYLSSGYQVNAGKTELIDNKVALIEQQKSNIKLEIEQINQRVTTLNEARKSQEARLPQMSRAAAKPVYEDMARAAEEIKGLQTRVQQLQTTVFDKDNELITLNSEGNAVHDIGTFKFVAESLNLPLDTIVKIFIICIVIVFDPLAVALVLAYNIIKGGSVLKENKVKVSKTNTDIIETEVLTPAETEKKPIVVNASGVVISKS